jgi:pyruvate dehydrogenase E2 component (dihydrolipoamide acetyltransferase)
VTASTSGRGEVRIEEPSRAQRAVARRTAESRATVPDLELSVEIDMTACLALQDAQSWSLTAIGLKACALALREVPRANAAYRDGRFELYGRVNVGLVVPTVDALAIPVLFDADRQPLAQLSDDVQRLTERAYAGELTPPELSGATFTFADVGAYGIAGTSPMIAPPHAGAVAAGAVRATPKISAGDVVLGHAMTITLAADHRILYGEQAFRFLAAIRSHLEDATL